jgi:polyisoprenoid-binding protein YceI
VTKNGHIRFFSGATAENIEANNNQVNCAMDASNGNLVFKVLIKSFEFEKALMQEHFNENYLESDKYPNSTFSGVIQNISEIKLDQNGDYKVIVKGSLSIHGVTKEVQQEGQLVVKDGKVSLMAVFMIKLEDYKVKIPKTVAENIAEEIEITVNVTLDKMP